MGTLCPACGAAGDVGAEERCPWCGLDWRGAEAAELRRLIDEVGDLDRELATAGERRRVIAEELDHRRWAVTRNAPHPFRSAPGPGRWPHAYPSSEPRSTEWSIDRVRSVLLWVGAALLAASALTFTTVAWTHLNDGGRALLLAGVTTACIGAALGLRQRLPATAEAFTALSIALALIDWQALRRAGVTADLSTTASWAVGLGVVSALAYALGHAVGKRTCRVAMALLLPLAVVFGVSTVCGATWSFALAYSLIAGGLVVLWRRLHDRPDLGAVGMALTAHALVWWPLAALLSVVATFQAHSFTQALVPSFVLLTLAFAPLARLRPEATPGEFAVLATLVLAAVAGAIVAVPSSSFGAEGMLAWATLAGSAVIIAARALPPRWTKPGFLTAGGFSVPGLFYATLAAAAAIFGPLSWLPHVWEGSLAASAREVLSGPGRRIEWSAGWPAVFVLVALAVAIVAIAVPLRRRAALVSASAAFESVATLSVLALCLAPVVAGASVGVTFATTTATLCAVLVATAVFDRSRREPVLPLLSVAILPAIASTGWALQTSTASIVVLSVTCVAAVLATAVAVSESMRIALGTVAGGTVIALAGVVAIAAGTNEATAGFAMAVAAGFVILIGVHARSRAAEGVALEVIGTVGFAIGASIAAQQPAWLAGAFTVIVPMFLVAAFRRDRRTVYSFAAVATSVGATWAWLAAAHVTVVEAYTAPAALIALAVGLVEWRHGPARSWLTLGPAIVLGLGPTLMLGVVHDDVARSVIAAVLAFAIVMVGAWKQLQAPLVLGSIALLTLATVTFGPSLARLPRWLPTAVIGLLLMWIGATFETRRDRAKRATESLLHFG